MSLTIYHNPRCSKSRRTLELIREHGVEATIVHYLDEPPSARRILEIAGLLGCPVSELLRETEDEYVPSTTPPALDDDRALAAWIAAHPRALQRPIVVDDDRGVAVIGRPPESILGLLP